MKSLGQSEELFLAFVETQKRQKLSVRIAFFPAMIRTSTPMFKLEHYLFNNVTVIRFMCFNKEMYL